MKYRTVRCILDRDNRYLFAQHNNRRPETVGKWGLPGGHIEKAEDFLTAVNREILEEFSIKIDNWREVADYSYLLAWHKVFVAKYTGPPKLVFDHREILDIRWLSFEEVKEYDNQNKLHTGFELEAITKYRGSF